MDRKNIKSLVSIGIPFLATIASLLSVFAVLLDIKGMDSFSPSPFSTIIISTLGIAVGFLIIKSAVKGKKAKIFVSYSHSDREFVDSLVSELRAARFEIHYDDEVVNIGDNIKDKIVENIKASDAVLFVLSNPEATQNWFELELKTAIENKKKVLPILRKKDSYIPKELNGIKYADFSSNSQPDLKLLLKSLNEISYERHDK